MSRLFNKKKKKAPASQDIPLNITAMADIFTILLVFLLKSFSSGAVSLSPSQGLILPKADAQAPYFEALKIEISQNAILVEEKPVSKLKDFQFEKADVQSNRSSRSLSQALQSERKRQLYIAKRNKSVKIDPKVMIIADQRAPYRTIKSVLASAAVNGYTDFKLAVIQNE